MSDGPEWFAPKRFGYGAGLPISWQGWVLTIGFVLASAALGVVLARKPLAFIAVMVPLTLAFVLIAANTTKGGWRWRWGKRDGR